MQNFDNDDFFGNVVSVYSRAQAIEDGVLADVSEQAKEAGFKNPVAITAAVWGDYVEWTEEDTKRQLYQDTQGRLWDILNMLNFAIRAARENSEICFKVLVVPRCSKSRRKKPKLVELKAVCGAGDKGEPIITIMKPSED